MELFLKMGNQKALGVANNNLGAMVLQEMMENTTLDENNYFKGIRYFEEAIRIGSTEYESASDVEDEEKGNYVKQLANRYFNRGMFFVINKSHPQAPWNILEIGITGR